MDQGSFIFCLLFIYFLLFITFFFHFIIIRCYERINLLVLLV